MDDKSTHRRDEANQVDKGLIGRFLTAAVRNELCCGHGGRWPAPLMAEMAKGG